MLGQLLLQSAMILWLVQLAHTGGYGVISGRPNGQGPQPNGKKPQTGGGVGRLLMPSKGVGQTLGVQNGYGGYPTKGLGYGAAAGVTKGGGTKGYGVQSSSTNGQQMKGIGYGTQAGGYGGQGTKGYGAPAPVAPNGNGGNLNGYGATAGIQGGNGAKPSGNGAAVGQNGPGTKGKGYGVQAGPTNGQQMKGNGYSAQAGGYGRQGTKGNGNPATAATYNGLGTKGKDYGAGSGVSNGNGAKTNGAAAGGNWGRPNGQGGAGSKPVKGYGQPPYGAGPGTGMGAVRGLGVPQLARNQKTQAYGSNGYNGYGAQPMGGYTGGYGSAGLGLGPRYGNGGMKGPKQGYGAAAGVANGQGAITNGYGYPSGGVTKPAKPGHGNVPNRYGPKPNGYGAIKGGAVRPQPANGKGTVPTAYGTKPNGYGVAPGTGAGLPKGHGTKPNGHAVRNGAALGGYGGYRGTSKDSKPQFTKGVGAVLPSEGTKTLGTGYGMMPKGKSAKAVGAFNGKGLKGQVLSPEQPSAAPEQGVTPQQATTQGAAPVAPEPTSGILVMVTQEKYHKLPSSVPQTKSYKQTPLIPQAIPEPAPAVPEEPNPAPEPTPGPAPARSKEATSGPTPLVAQINPAPEPAAVLPQENGRGPSITKGQGAKPSKPDCGPSGVPNGQWIKIPRPGYNAVAGPSSGTDTKGYGAGAGVSNGYGAKPNGYGAGDYTVPGLANGYGAGLGYPYGGQHQLPGYGQGVYLGAGYGKGNSYGGLGEAGKSKSGYGNGYSAGVQPDYASLGRGLPAANGKSGDAGQIPYNGAPVVPAGIDGMSHFEPQAAGFGPSLYGGMDSLPFGGQTLGMGAEKSNTKYGIGGLQFGGKPLSMGINGAGHYGYGGNPYGPAGDGKSSGKYGSLGASGDPAPGKYGYGGFPSGGQLLGANGNTASKYGHGRMLYESQPAGLSPEAKSAGKSGLAGSPYQPEPLGLGQNGKLTGNYAGGEVPYAPQPLSFGTEAKSSGKYDNQGSYQARPLESASEGRPDGEYVRGEVPTPATAVEGEGMSIDRYENVGYINGQVQPEVVAFPAAPTSSPAQAYPSVPSYLPVDSSFSLDVVPGAGTEDLPDPVGTASLAVDSIPASETQDVPEHPDDLLQQQIPRQIHIQQHLKLHFHHQGAKNGKYDLNGFFGNSGYQG